MGVLDGVRVLDFGRYIAGPYCAAMLGDLGADVIRVERVSGGDDRVQYPVADGDRDGGACFLQMNRNKRGMTLNPTKPGGQEVLARLVAEVDVVVANLPGESLREMGLDYQSLKAIKPDIILVGISAFGAEGPYADRVGFDGIGQAMSGAVYLSGSPEQPMKSYASWVDVSTALYSTIGALAAIMEKKASGRGQEVQTALFASAVTLFNFNMIEQAIRGVDRRASGNRIQSSGPGDIVATIDGWIMVQVVGDPLFERWARMVGRPELVCDPRFLTDVGRAEHGEVLSAITAKWSAQFSTAQALDKLAEARVPGGPVYSPQDVLDDPHVQATGMFTPMDYPGVPKPVPVSMGAVKLSETPAELRLRPPTLGEHTDAILAGVGYSAAEIAELRARRVV